MEQSHVKQTDMVCHCTALALEQATKRTWTLLARFVCLHKGYLHTCFKEKSTSLRSCRSEEEQECTCLHVPSHSHFLLFKVLHKVIVNFSVLLACIVLPIGWSLRMLDHTLCVMWCFIQVWKWLIGMAVQWKLNCWPSTLRVDPWKAQALEVQNFSLLEKADESWEGREHEGNMRKPRDIYLIQSL